MKQRELVTALTGKFSLEEKQAKLVVDQLLAMVLEGVRSPEGLRAKQFVLRQRPNKRKPDAAAKAGRPADPNVLRCILRVKDPEEKAKGPKKGARNASDAD